ncbi:MAG TPA: LysR family transcriptional regulator [Hyphomicrobiaceae bacterium]|nr:LysR family transcriptional regulator [Hyphomicrobiaceae bacterium]
MDYRQLQLFLATAERLNLSHAAEAMSITQPGLSKSMHRLQKELGTKLYHRRGRGIELTESGRALLRHVKVIETQLSDARSEVMGIAGGKLGHARIGAGPSWLSRHLPESIARVMQQNPNIRFTVDTGFPDRLIGRLRMGELDVVVGALPDNRIDPDLRFMRLSSDVIRVVGRREHPLARKRDRSLVDYAAQRWILPGRQELVRQRLQRVFMLANLAEPLLAVETDSLSLMLATLRMTDCLALTTTQILSQPEAQGIVALDHEHLQFTREAGIVSRRHADLSPAVKLMIAQVRKIAAKYGPN